LTASLGYEAASAILVGRFKYRKKGFALQASRDYISVFYATLRSILSLRWFFAS